MAIRMVARTQPPAAWRSLSRDGTEARMSSTLPAYARAIVVGGGVIGTSIAYHLAKLGWSDIVLLERDRLTSGTTWHAAGLIASAQMASETKAFITQYSRQLYIDLEAETGLGTGFRKCGHLHLASTPTRKEAMRREINFLRMMGIEKHEISAREAGDMFPLLDTDGIISAIWSPDDGRANPVDVTMSLAAGARALIVRNGLRPDVVSCEFERMDATPEIMTAGGRGGHLYFASGMSTKLRDVDYTGKLAFRDLADVQTAALRLEAARKGG